MPRTIRVLLLVVFAAGHALAEPYTEQCPEQDRQRLVVASARGVVAERCGCADAARHSRYVKCAKREVKALVRAGRLPKPCKHVVIAFERRSTCGRGDAAVCCRTTRRGKAAANVARADRCTRRGGAACGGCAAPGAACIHSVFDACSADAACAGADDGAAPAPVHSHLLPTAELLFGWIEDLVSAGIRRPGYPADDRAEQWIADRFTDLGLEDVRLDPIDVQRWEPRSCTLGVWPAGNPGARQDVPCFPVPFSTPTAGLTGPVTLLEDGADVSGRIALVDNTFITLPQQVALDLFATDFYDASGDLASSVQTLPFSARFQNVMEPAIAAGATGFVGIVDGLPWDTDQYYVPYDAKERPIPGVWLSQSNGARVKALLAAGPVEAEIGVDATLAPTTSHDVIGMLPGASDEWVIIGSHHDGPWASAVEDASGTALVLGQALYWSQVPAAERPHNLLFLLNGGHMSGGAGLIAFVTRNADWLDQVVLELHLEHVAREARGENGVLVPTERPEIRWWFTTRIPALEHAVKQAIVSEDIDRSIMMAPDGFPPGSAAPPTDGAFFHPAGVPIVNLLAAPMYLFDAGDTVDMIHTESLVPVSRAAARIVAWTAGQTAAGMRAAAP